MHCQPGVQPGVLRGCTCTMWSGWKLLSLAASWNRQFLPHHCFTWLAWLRAGKFKLAKLGSQDTSKNIRSLPLGEFITQLRIHWAVQSPNFPSPKSSTLSLPLQALPLHPTTLMRSTLERCFSGLCQPPRYLTILATGLTFPLHFSSLAFLTSIPGQTDYPWPQLWSLDPHSA